MTHLFTVITDIGAGLIFGFAVGYAARKMLPLMISLLILLFFWLLYISYRGYVYLNYRMIDLWNIAGPEPNLIMYIPFAVPFLIGVYLGWRKG